MFMFMPALVDFASNAFFSDDSPLREITIGEFEEVLTARPIDVYHITSHRFYHLDFNSHDLDDVGAM